MRRLSLRLFALGLALGATAVLAANAYARSTSRHHARNIGRPVRHAPGAQESGKPVIDWNRVLLSIVNTPGARAAKIHPARNFAILHAAIFDAVNAIDRTHEPLRATRTHETNA